MKRFYWPKSCVNKGQGNGFPVNISLRKDEHSPTRALLIHVMLEYSWSDIVKLLRNHDLLGEGKHLWIFLQWQGKLASDMHLLMRLYVQALRVHHRALHCRDFPQVSQRGLVLRKVFHSKEVV